MVSYFDDILNKDVIRRYNIRKIDELIYLATFYLTNISSPVNFTSLEKVLDITADTIETFSSYLKNAFLIFFIKEGLKIKWLVQVCWDISSVETRKRETRALLKASKELKCNNLLIITGEYEDEEKVRNKKIRYTPLWKWLLIDKIKA